MATTITTREEKKIRSIDTELRFHFFVLIFLFYFAHYNISEFFVAKMIMPSFVLSFFVFYF